MEYINSATPSEVFLHSPYSNPTPIKPIAVKKKSSLSPTAAPFQSKFHTSIPSHLPCQILTQPLETQTSKGFSKGRNDRLLYDGVPVCLDYLKGTCSLKRPKCRFAHPPLSVPASNTNQAICEVFLLTGFCKFGAQCRDFHPPLHSFSPICSPARTTRMTTECKEAAAAKAEVRERMGGTTTGKKAAKRAAKKSPSDHKQSLESEVVASLTSLVKELTEASFHTNLQSISDTISTHKASACLAVLLPATYSEAIQSPDRARLYGKFCQYLTNVLPTADRQQMRGKLMELCGKLLFHFGELSALLGDGPDGVRLLEGKRINNAHFVGSLHNFGVFGSNYTSRVVEFLLSKALLDGMGDCPQADPTSHSELLDPEAQLHIRLLCALLNSGKGGIAAEPTPQVVAALRHLSDVRPTCSLDVASEIQEAIVLDCKAV